MVVFDLPLKNIKSKIEGLTDIEYDIVESLSGLNLSAMDVVAANERELTKHITTTFLQHGGFYVEEYGSRSAALFEIRKSTCTLRKKLQKQLLEDAPY